MGWRSSGPGSTWRFLGLRFGAGGANSPSRSTPPAVQAGEVAAQRSASPGVLSRRAKKSMLAAYERHGLSRLRASTARVNAFVRDRGGRPAGEPVLQPRQPDEQ